MTRGLKLKQAMLNPRFLVAHRARILTAKVNSAPENPKT